MSSSKLVFILLLQLYYLLCGHNLYAISKEYDGFHRDSRHYKDGEHNHEFDHESVLGGHNVAEEFDHLPPEEAKSRLGILARKMDQNKDEFVDHKELTNWVLKSFKMLTEEEAQDQLEDEDGDNDGKITWDEHIAETYGIYDSNAINTDPEKLEDYKMMQNDKEIFNAADLNDDGILDKSEFPLFSHPEEFEQMHEIVYKQTMEKRDTNSDGFLSFDEFIGEGHNSQLEPNSEHYLLEKDRFENDFDKDKSGKLEKAEVLLWLIPNDVEMAETEADHLIESSDENKDGVLSIDEIVNHHDVFVGSEATDFGEHLHDTNKFMDEL